MHKQKSKRRKSTFHAIGFLGMFITCIVVITVAIIKGESLEKEKDSSTVGKTNLSEGNSYTDSEANRSSDNILVYSRDNTDSNPNNDEEQWNLILVNRWNPLPEGYNPTVTQLKNGHAIDERAYPDLQDMMDDCRAAGLEPVICSSFRTMEKQQTLFKNKVDEYLAKGYSQEMAEKATEEYIAVPGTSEHQLALALDIVDISNQHLDESQENTPVQKWLMKNSWKYGFILRYPTDKSDITGISYEPWHYRYVGKDAAKEIYESGVCLEEYLENR